MENLLFYFELQYKMFKRHLVDFGIHPVIGQALIVLVFIGSSIKLFNYSNYAGYGFTLAGIFVVSLCSEPRRNAFLKSIYPVKSFMILRLIENVVISSPFILVLICYQKYWLALLMILFASLLSRYTAHLLMTFIIPTPFFKYPFEFTVGFRNTYLAIIFAYFLTCMSIRVGNFNLGAFSMVMIFLICCSYYVQLEHEFYIWIHRASPKLFLVQKLKIAITYCTWLCLPIMLALGIVFPVELKTLLIVLLIGLLYLMASVLSKYASYPHNPTLAQIVLIAITILFPPLIILVMIFFYFKSIHRLKQILT